MRGLPLRTRSLLWRPHITRAPNVVKRYFDNSSDAFEAAAASSAEARTAFAAAEAEIRSIAKL